MKKKLVNGYHLALLQSLGRIEFMLKTIMQEEYGEKATKKVCKEICDLINKKITEDDIYVKEKKDEIV